MHHQFSSWYPLVSLNFGYYTNIPAYQQFSGIINPSKYISSITSKIFMKPYDEIHHVWWLLEVPGKQRRHLVIWALIWALLGAVSCGLSAGLAPECVDPVPRRRREHWRTRWLDWAGNKRGMCIWCIILYIYMIQLYIHIIYIYISYIYISYIIYGGFNMS